MDDGIPGPGTYQVEKPLRKVPKWSAKYRVRPRQFKPPEKIILKPWETARFEV
jgi:hypothetical protein